MARIKDIIRHGGQPEPRPLAVEGISPAPATPEPDDAELAAQAVLETLMERQAQKAWHLWRLRKAGKDAERENRQASPPDSQEKTSAYYQRLRKRIYAAHEASRLRTLRFLAFCEQELQKPHLPANGPGSLELLEVELFKRIDTVEREQGELKQRWQQCLATVIVRQMQIEKHH